MMMEIMTDNKSKQVMIHTQQPPVNTIWQMDDCLLACLGDSIRHASICGGQAPGTSYLQLHCFLRNDWANSSTNEEFAVVLMLFKDLD